MCVLMAGTKNWQDVVEWRGLIFWTSAQWFPPIFSPPGNVSRYRGNPKKPGIQVGAAAGLGTENTKNAPKRTRARYLRKTRWRF